VVTFLVAWVVMRLSKPPSRLGPFLDLEDEIVSDPVSSF
jgi:hypothetical protein